MTPTFDGGQFVVDGMLPLNQFTSAFAARWCADLARCGPLSQSAFEACLSELPARGEFAFVLDERATSGPFTSGEYHLVPQVWYAQEVNAGRLAYDPAAGARCVSGAFDGCNENFPADTLLCDDAFSGQVGDGGSCFLTIECDAGPCSQSCPSTCPASSGGTAPVLGGPCSTVYEGEGCPDGSICGGALTCVIPGGAGAACAATQDCLAGLYCHQSVCEPQVQPGGACGQDAAHLAGALLVPEQASAPVPPQLGPDWPQCAGGQVCRGSWAISLADGGIAAVGAGTCSPPSDVGGSCVEPPSGVTEAVTGCRYGLVCSCGVCAVPPSTGPCVVTAEPTPCGVGFTCQLGQCTPWNDQGAGLFCAQ